MKILVIAICLALGLYLFQVALYRVFAAIFPRAFGAKVKPIRRIAGGNADTQPRRGFSLNVRLSDLTVWGWMLALVTVGIIFALMIPWGRWLYDMLPPGMYPALLFALPVLLLGLAVFFLGAVFMNAMGLRVLRCPRGLAAPNRSSCRFTADFEREPGRTASCGAGAATHRQQPETNGKERNLKKYVKLNSHSKRQSKHQTNELK